MLTLVFIPFLLIPFQQPSARPSISSTMFAYVIAIGGIWMMATSLRFRLTLTPHALTLRRAFTSRTMERWDMAFYALVCVKGSTTLFLTSRSGKNMKFSCEFADRDAVLAWLKGIAH